MICRFADWAHNIISAVTCLVLCHAHNLCVCVMLTSLYTYIYIYIYISLSIISTRRYAQGVDERLTGRLLEMLMALALLLFALG